MLRKSFTKENEFEIIYCMDPSEIVYYRNFFMIGIHLKSFIKERH